MKINDNKPVQLRTSLLTSRLFEVKRNKNMKAILQNLLVILIFIGCASWGLVIGLHGGLSSYFSPFQQQLFVVIVTALLFVSLIKKAFQSDKGQAVDKTATPEPKRKQESQGNIDWSKVQTMQGNAHKLSGTPIFKDLEIELPTVKGKVLEPFNVAQKVPSNVAKKIATYLMTKGDLISED